MHTEDPRFLGTLSHSLSRDLNCILNRMGSTCALTLMREVMTSGQKLYERHACRPMTVT